MDHSGDESLLKQQNNLPWNAVGFVFNILQLLFWSIWQGSGKCSSHSNQVAILFVSEINLKVLKYSFQPPLIFSFYFKVAPSQSWQRRKESRATADTKNTTKMSCQSSRPQETLKQFRCCSCFRLLKITPDKVIKYIQCLNAYIGFHF